MKTQQLFTAMCVAIAGLSWGSGPAHAQYVPPPQLVPGVNYNQANFANSPILTKFKDSLPGLGSAGANNLGNYIPVATAAPNGTVPGVPSDAAYYEIALVDYTQKLHSDLNPTKLRGYVQIEPPGVPAPAGGWPGSLHVPLMDIQVNPPVQITVTVGGVATPVFAYDSPRYLGPTVVAQKGTPTRIKFYNLLPVGAAGDLFIPTDVTVDGAGIGPDGTSYTQNRATLHLHGGDNPWVSDGTAHQWITPAGETASLTNGVSQRNVPDMPVPAKGSATFYWPNGQSGRLMFYHDHAYGITRLNVYAGSAAGYLLVDPNERGLNSFAPGGEIPLVIQDKTFVWGTTPAALNPATGFYEGGDGTWANDPLWASNPKWGQAPGSLWLPHVYVPNQNPLDVTGANPFGRWDYGAWFWPVFPSGIPPQVTIVPESFMDTPLINGQAYPYLNVEPKAYRLRVLNACNDRFMNLQLYVASPIVSAITVASGGGPYTVAPAVSITPAQGDTTGRGATATAIIDTVPTSPTFGQVTSITVDTVGCGYTIPPTVVIAPPSVGGSAATATAVLYNAPTEVGMVPASPSAGIAFPAWWTVNDTPGMTPNILDGRAGGVPDPRMMGPSFIQIGMEGGIAPAPTVLDTTPIGYEQNKRSVTVLNTLEHTLWMGPAERADVIVDFAPFAGKTLILYNDAPAPVPAGDPRYAYFTCNPDMTGQGGAAPTQAGKGPNIRTIMQIKVGPGAPNAIASVNLTAPGSGYTAPVVTITDTPPGTGSGATASATVSPGIVQSIAVTLDGFLYASPVVTIAPTGGDTPTVAATATATTWAFGGIASITVVNPGAGYNHPPTVTITDAAAIGQWATATATIVPAGQITGLTLLTPGTGYTAPLVTITDTAPGTGSGATATATVVPAAGLVPLNPASLNAPVAAAFAATQPAPIVPAGVYARISDTQLTLPAGTQPLLPKTIQELFDPLGRMNATLGVEIPFTTALIQTTIPYGFSEPATEVIPDGGIQLWKITHNGVDTHAIHFHLFNVQVVNRVGWDGAIKPPWPEELGWKETVKMNPLEDIIVALHAKTPTVPFAQPDNIRPLDPSKPATFQFTGIVDPNNNPVPAFLNASVNFGNEYTWHCHLLGHEENDMMRPIMVAVAPPAPSNLTGTRPNGSTLILNWVNNATAPTAFTISRANNAAFTLNPVTFTTPGNVTTYTDNSYRQNQVPYYYRVTATTVVGSGVLGFPSVTNVSAFSNVLGPPTGTTTNISVTQAAATGSPVVVRWSYSPGGDQTGFTIQRSTSSTFTTGLTTFTAAATATSFNDTTRVAGTLYYYRVFATNPLGNGTPSNVRSITPHG